MNQPKLVLRALLLLGMFVAGAFFGGFVAFFVGRTQLQVLRSLDGEHEVELVRSDHLDRNYLVYVDGRRVYVSPDFAPGHDFPFRESLLWDATGRVILLEVAGHRIFGYDVAAQRRLIDSELLAAKAAAEPPLWKYHFESEWPGIGRVRQPE